MNNVHSGSNMHWTFGVYLCWDKAKLFNIIKSTQPKKKKSLIDKIMNNVFDNTMYEILTILF